VKPEKYVLSLSGGKDSTAMLLRLLEENRPVDLILFCDTGIEFPQMYEHINRLEAYINRPIIRLQAEHDFEYYFNEYSPKRKNPALEQHKGLSWPGPRGRWCTGILKTRVIAAYLREMKKQYEVIDAERHPDLAAQYGIMQAPTLLVVEDGQAQKIVNASNIQKYVDEYLS